MEEKTNPPDPSLQCLYFAEGLCSSFIVCRVPSPRSSSLPRPSSPFPSLPHSPAPLAPLEVDLCVINKDILDSTAHKLTSAPQTPRRPFG